MLTAARRQGLPLSVLCAGLPARLTASERLSEINRAAGQRLLARIADDWQALRALLAPDAGSIRSIDQTDGLRVTFADGSIVHLRLSGNARELRCYVEAAWVEEAERLCQQCLDRIGHELN